MTATLSLRIKQTLATAFCLCLLTQVRAQTKVTGFGSYGISDIHVTGLGLLDLIDPYIKPISAYTAGFQIEKAIGQKLAFVTGAQYASRGFTARDNFNIKLFGVDLPVDARIDTRLQYIEVPAMLKYSIKTGAITPYLKAGASAAYAIDGKLQPKIDAIITWKLPAININLQDNLYNRFDVSGIIGAGVDVPVNENGSFQFDINYRHSLDDMFLDKITDIRIKSHTFSAGIGYTLSF